MPCPRLAEDTCSPAAAGKSIATHPAGLLSLNGCPVHLWGVSIKQAVVTTVGPLTYQHISGMWEEAGAARVKPMQSWRDSAQRTLLNLGLSSCEAGTPTSRQHSPNNKSKVPQWL